MPPVAHWGAKVLARRRSGRYAVLTVAAGGVADRCRAGHFASVSVAGQDSSMLLRRQVWIANSSASGRDGGALELVIDSAEPGGRRVAALEPGSVVDLMAPLGRPFSHPREPVGVVMVAGGGVAAAPLIRLAADLGARGCRVTFLAAAHPEPFGMLDAKRVSTATAVIQASWTSESPNSWRIGIPSTPNMSHTANIKVKPAVDQTRTGTRPRSVLGSVTARLKHSGHVIHG